MSLYNKLFGVNDRAPQIIAELFDFGVSALGNKRQYEATIKRIPRFRDAYINKDKQLVLYTRTGGGNREYYERRTDENAEYTGLFNEDLRKLPGFVRDYDDTYDSTFAHFIYEVHTQRMTDMLQILDPSFYIGQEPRERMEKLLEAIKNKDESNPDLANAMKVGEQIFAKINEAMADLAATAPIIIET